MSREELLDEEPFSYRHTKAGLVRISYRGKVVTTLSGKRATRFLQSVETGTREDAQLLMARATGHFKHGNERP